MAWPAEYQVRLARASPWIYGHLSAARKVALTGLKIKLKSEMVVTGHNCRADLWKRSRSVVIYSGRLSLSFPRIITSILYGTK